MDRPLNCAFKQRVISIFIFANHFLCTIAVNIRKRWCGVTGHRRHDGVLQCPADKFREACFSYKFVSTNEFFTIFAVKNTSYP